MAPQGEFDHLPRDPGSRSLDKMVISPFSVLVKVVNGKVAYLQFLEDSYATAVSFRKDGSWAVHTETGAEPFQV
jgi:hypothetical protein